MKIKGNITFLVDRDSTRIEIIDENSSTTICEIELTPNDLSAILSRQSHVKCEISIGVLDRVGKKHENKHFEFEVPTGVEASSKNENELAMYANTLLTDGWRADKYFGAQNSFFTKDGKRFARAIIRRYI